MTSILTNPGAMTALQTLRSINQNLAQTQNEISTGKTIASAKDNSAIWAISKVMESDVAGFKAIKNSLSLGESSVAVARNASESITSLLTDIKGKIVAAQEENVDRAKIQTDIGQLRDQITSIVNAAQFNGLNLVKGTDDVNILSSLDRAADGTVSSSNITIARQDMTATNGTNGIGTAGSTDISAQMLDAAGAPYSGPNNIDNAGNAAILEFTSTAGDDWDIGSSASVTVGGQTVTYTVAADDTTDDAVRDGLLAQLNALDLDDVSFAATTGGGGEVQLTVTSTRAFEDSAFSVSESATAAGENAFIVSVNGDATGFGAAGAESGSIAQRAEVVNFTTGTAPSEGNSYQVSLGGTAYFYTAGKGETMEDVARGLKTAIDGAGLADISTSIAIDGTTGQVSLKVDNNVASAVALDVAAGTGGTASGGLFGLDQLNVGTDGGADAALENIETMIQNAIDASAAFGSAQSRVETQSEFVSKLTDSLKAGIGTMVDADLEEASARLQALQVQQQLGTQSLSIANQAPQSILALFR